MHNSVCDFLELAVHSILSARKIYPPGSFEIKRRYDIPVKISKSPELCHYIANVVNSMQQWIEEASLHKMVLNIYDTAEMIVERFVFDIEYTPIGTQKVQSTEASVCAFLSKMSVLNSTLIPLPQECTFSIFVHGDFDGGDLACKEEKSKWVNSSILPLKYVTCEDVKIQVRIPQVQAQFAQKDTTTTSRERKKYAAVLDEREQQILRSMELDIGSWSVFACKWTRGINFKDK